MTDRAKAAELRALARRDHDDLHAEHAIAAALAAERERARAPFLAYADECAAVGNDRKAGIFKRAVNRAVAEAIRRAAARPS